MLRVRITQQVSDHARAAEDDPILMAELKQTAARFCRVRYRAYDGPDDLLGAIEDALRTEHKRNLWLRLAVVAALQSGLLPSDTIEVVPVRDGLIPDLWMNIEFAYRVPGSSQALPE